VSPVDYTDIYSDITYSNILFTLNMDITKEIIGPSVIVIFIERMSKLHNFGVVAHF